MKHWFVRNWQHIQSPQTMKCNFDFLLFLLRQGIGPMINFPRTNFRVFLFFYNALSWLKKACIRLRSFFERAQSAFFCNLVQFDFASPLNCIFNVLLLLFLLHRDPTIIGSSTFRKHSHLL